MKTKQTYTPGPWTISEDGTDVNNVEGAGVCAIYADESSEANARLIAASPDLLEALTDAAEMFESVIADLCKDLSPAALSGMKYRLAKYQKAISEAQ